MKKTTIALSVILVVMFIAGCVGDYFWPCVRDPLAIGYTNQDPNTAKWYTNTLATSKTDRVRIEISHAEKQIALKAKLGIDDATYAALVQISNLNIQASQTAFNKWIGSIESPGWLPTAVLGLLGISGTALYAKGTMYSEAELQAAITKAKDEVFRSGIAGCTTKPVT